MHLKFDVTIESEPCLSYHLTSCKGNITVVIAHTCSWNVLVIVFNRYYIVIVIALKTMWINYVLILISVYVRKYRFKIVLNVEWLYNFVTLSMRNAAAIEHTSVIIIHIWYIYSIHYKSILYTLRVKFN